MLKLIVLESICFLWLLCGSQLLGFGIFSSCPNSTNPVKNLNVTRYLGNWYTYSMYSIFASTMPHCKVFNYSPGTDETYFYARTSHTDVNSTKHESLNKISATDFEMGLLGTSDDEHHIHPHVLDTDYDNFAIQFMCNETDEFIAYQWAVILTRLPVPSPDVIKTARQKASQQGLRLTRMMKVEQKNCQPDQYKLVELPTI